MPLPLAHGLVGAGIVIAARREFSWRKDWRPLLVGSILAFSPDFDLLSVWLPGRGTQAHGGPTHSILFAIPLGMLGALLAREFNGRGLMVFTSIALSHGLLDFATKKNYGGAQLLWPFSRHKFRLGLFSYYEFSSEVGVQPLLEILKEALKITYYEAMVFLPLFLAVVVWKQWRQRQAP